jgi:hypothetical protein
MTVLIPIAIFGVLMYAAQLADAMADHAAVSQRIRRQR